MPTKPASVAADTGRRAPLPRRVVLAYASGSIGTVGFSVLPGLVLAFYLTNVLAVSAALASLVVLLPKVLDLLLDPLIGSFSDTQRDLAGHRGQGMAWGAVLLVPLFILTFSAPANLTGASAALWVLLCFTLTSVAFSFFQIPYVALPAELSPVPAERTRLVTIRIGFLTLAIILFGAGGPAIREAFGGAHQGYLVMAVVSAGVIGLGFLHTVTGAVPTTRTTPRDPAAHSGREQAQVQAQVQAQPRRRPRERRATAGGSGARGGLLAHPGLLGYRRGLEALREHRGYRLIVAVLALEAIANSVLLAGAQYVATYTLDNPAALTPLFLALVAPALAVLPLWHALGRRLGKRRGLIVATVVFTAATAALALATVNPGWWIYLAVTAAGVGYAGMQVYPLAIFADMLAEIGRDSGPERGGALAGLWTATETLAMALGPAIYLAILSACGFVSSTADVAVAQSGTALTGVVLGFALVPAGAALLSILLLVRLPTPTEATP